MIALKNNSGSNLAQLIIGNEVDGLVNTHFVRKPDENEVYRVKCKMSMMSAPNSLTG